MSQQGVGGLRGSVDVGGGAWRACSLPLPSLNVKCLTGRLSEEGLQRTEAPLEPGGGAGGALAAASHCHSAKTGHISTHWLQFKLPTSTTNVVGAVVIYRRRIRRDSAAIPHGPARRFSTRSAAFASSEEKPGKKGEINSHLMGVQLITLYS